MEVLPSHLTTRNVIISSTLPAKTSLLTGYAKNLIHQVRIRSEGGVHHGRSIPETWGDLLIRGIWESHMEAIIDSDFQMLMRIPIRKREWMRFSLGGKK